MFIPELKTFHDVIKPLFYFNCLLGVDTFRLPSQSSITYNFMKLYSVSITLFSWAMILSRLMIILKEPRKVENVAPMSHTMYQVLICTNSCVAVIAPLLVRLQKKGLMNCLRRMPILDKTLQTVHEAPDYRKQYILMIWRIVAILLITIVAGISDNLPELQIPVQMEIQSGLAYGVDAYVTHYPLLVMLLLDLNFCTFVAYLERKFRDVNHSLVRLIEKPSVSCRGEGLSVIPEGVRRTMLENEITNTETGDLMNDKHYLLRKTRKAHLELCKMAREINHAFGIQNLLSMGISFTMITGMLYTIYSAFTWEHLTNRKVMEVIGTATWTVIYALEIWVVNHSCWSVSNEATDTGEVIYELLDTKVDREFQQEIQEFGIQMLQNPVRFNACGFFTLDYTFVQGVIGSVTTYLVILIQMSSGFQRSFSDTAAADNDTNVSSNL